MEHVLYKQLFRLQQTHWWFAARRNYIASFLDRFPPEGSVLDVGCGPGSMLSFLSRFGTVTGLDPYRPALRMARTHFNGPLVEGTAERLPFGDNCFGLVTAFEVLYHRRVRNVETALAELCRVLAPGGYLVVADSAYAALESGHDRVSHSARRFSKGQMCRYFENAGLEVVTATYAYAALLPAVYAIRKLKGLHGATGRATTELKAVPSWINQALIKWFAVEARLAKHYPLPFGLSVQVMGRKSPY